MKRTITFTTALRPFSLIVAIAGCGLGISLALLEGADDYLLALLVMLAGLLLQVGVNLINDYGDIGRPELDSEQVLAIRHNTRIGWMVMAIAILLGLWMVSIRGWPLLILGITGVLGAWGYTGAGINYKSRGLGVVMVFFLMGVLYIGGAYYVVSGGYHAQVFWLSLPFSLLTSLLLLSNELRDFEQDSAAGIKTLSVRLGYAAGVRIYYTLVLSLCLVSLLLYLLGLLTTPLLLLIALPLIWQPISRLNASQSERQRLPPLTGRLYLVYSLGFIMTLWTPLL